MLATAYPWKVSGFVPCSLLPYHFAQWDDTAKFAYSLLVVGSAVAGLVVCYFGAAKTPWAYLLEMDSCFSIPQAQAISTSPLLDEVNADFSSAVDLMDPIWSLWSDIACLRSLLFADFAGWGVSWICPEDGDIFRQPCVRSCGFVSAYFSGMSHHRGYLVAVVRNSSRRWIVFLRG